MKRRQFRNVLITGASSGIGAALATHYAAPGSTLALSGRDPARLTAIAEKCRALGAIAEMSTVDVRSDNEMREWIDGIDGQWPLDLVIANAGVSSGTAGGDTPASVDQAIRETNIDGVANTAIPALENFAVRGSGQLALVSSLAGFRPLPGAPAYSASKAWVLSYGLALRGRWSGSKVGVSVVCPGFVESRITDTNNFAMPGFMNATNAAKIIHRGLARNRAIIAFPRRTAWPVRLVAALPHWATDPLFRAIPQKE